MGKIAMFNMSSLDGFFAGPNGELDWHHVDNEFNDFAIAQLKASEGLIFGRVTYEMMAAYWPTEAAQRDDPAVAGLMNSMPKLVFSKTLKQVDWSNSRLAGEGGVEEIVELRRQAGRDWLLFGSADLASTLIRRGLIDEYRVMVNPVVLGKGKPLFKDAGTRLDLTLVSSRAFHNWNVLIGYTSPGADIRG